MKKTIKPFKRPPKRFQPKGLTVIYEDHDIVVVNKSAGLLTVRTEKIKNNTALNHLNEYVRKGNSKSSAQVFVVHRLDKDTSGILLFAKSEKAKAYLLDEWKNFSKKYYAVVDGILPKKEGIISSYLTDDNIYPVHSVKDPKKGTFAKTGYKVLKESKKYSLMEVTLHTGKQHQIRVHFADEGHPVAGDKLYGIKNKWIKEADPFTLHPSGITHPYTNEPMTFESKPPEYFTTFFKSKAAFSHNQTEIK